MSIVKWDPFQESHGLRGPFGRFFGPGLNLAAPESKEWVPAVDVLEDEGEITLKVEVPEVKKNDIHVELKDGLLILRGERKLEKEEKKENYRRIERSYGSFVRSFSLPESVDQKNIKAEAKDGVLRVTMPKLKPAKKEPSKIEVK